MDFQSIYNNLWLFLLYCLLALAWTFIQAVSGWVYGLSVYDGYKNKHPSGTTPGEWAKALEVDKWYVCVAYKLHHASLYAACSVSGFVLLYADLFLVKQINTSNASAGTGAIVVGFAALAIAGISGSLAKFLWKGEKIL